MGPRCTGCVVGDLTKDEYSQRKAVLERDLPPLEPQNVIDLGEAAAALTNFGLFWDKEQDAAERNKLLRHILEKVTQDEGKLVSVTPREAFLPYFQFGAEVGSSASTVGGRTVGLPRREQLAQAGRPAAVTDHCDA